MKQGVSEPAKKRPDKFKNAIRRMFGLNEEYREGLAGEECGNRPEDIISAALNLAEQRKAPVIIVSGAVTDNFDSFIELLATQLYANGLINDRRAKTQSLLSVLSSGLPIRDTLTVLAGVGNETRTLCYIGSFHQMDYNPKAAAELLVNLQNLIRAGRLVNPLVLNIPRHFCSEVNRIAPDLWNYAILYQDASLAVHVQTPKQGNGDSYRETSQVRQTSVPSQFHFPGSTLRQDVIQQPASPAVQSQPTSDVGGRYNIHEAAPDPRASRADEPWYKRDSELLQSETDGIQAILKDQGGDMLLSTLPGSKRLVWSTRLKYSSRRLTFSLNLRLIYSAAFSRSNPQIGIQIENMNEPLKQAIRRSPKVKRIIYDDPEIPFMFIVAGVRTSFNQSAAAATLQGLFQLLDSI